MKRRVGGAVRHRFGVEGRPGRLVLMSELTDAVSAALGGVENLLAHRDLGADCIDHRVRDGGVVRLAVLTSSGAESGEKTLEAAGLASDFDLIIGVDAVQKVKPHLRTYAHALEVLDVPAGEALLVAAHGWGRDRRQARRLGYMLGSPVANGISWRPSPNRTCAPPTCSTPHAR